MPGGPSMSELPTSPPEESAPRRPLVRFYAGLAAFAVVGLTLSFILGSDKQPERDFSGRYDVGRSNGCLGRTFDLRQSGQFAALASPGGADGSLRVDSGRITGTIECVDSKRLRASLVARPGSIAGLIGTSKLTATRVASTPPPEVQRSARPTDVAGTFELTPPSVCLGSEIEIEEAGRAVELAGAGRIAGSGVYVKETGRLTGEMTCVDGSAARIAGDAADRTIVIEVVSRGRGDEAGLAERIEATETRELSDAVAAFLLSLIVIVIAARLLGGLAVLLHQPRVMGEVVAGIALGPTVLGALAPDLSASLFPIDLINTLGIVANFGVIFFMFIIGARLDIEKLRLRIGHAVAVSNASLVIPMVLGAAAAVPAYELVAPEVDFTEFALFMAVAMSITAFPVLARILEERGLLSRSIGATALAAAAIDDVSAWFLIALATAFATSGSAGEVTATIGLAAGFCLCMFLIVRPLLSRALRARDGDRPLSATWLAGLLAAVLLSAYVTEWIGIAVIFGAFLMGLVMPRESGVAEETIGRIEDFVVILLLPVFFAYTGLRTNVALLDDPELWLIAGGLLLVAIVGKFAGAMLGARVAGMDWRRSAVLGTLMNTRGLTELIALNLALDLGVISEALFTCLVLMALVTTFMAGPLLNLLESRENREAPRGATPGAVPSS